MFNKKFKELRKRFGYTQEDMANIFHVSRQAIQKWETAASQPDLQNVLAIAAFFNVSIDYLLKNEDNRPVEVLRTSKSIMPEYEKIHLWEAYYSQLDVEYVQSYEEGRDIENLHRLFGAIGELPASLEKKQLADVIFKMVQDAPTRSDYKYIEPDELEDIRELRRSFDIKLENPDQNRFADKVRGAWLGRICGCLLGKPIEGIHRGELMTLLRGTGNYPMKRYIRRDELNDELLSQITFGLAKRNDYVDRLEGAAPIDDDTNYTVMASCVIDRYGRDFTPYDMREAWMSMQPKSAYCTAERVAYCNFVRGYSPHDSAIFKNPYREWIGAQIRGDYFGYINPCKPELAAEMALRDATISHIKNGIYGEMWVSAMLACAAGTENIGDIVLGGLEQIPQTSRLFETVYGIYTDWQNGVSEEKAFEKIVKVYDDKNTHHWCHTISNAAIVTVALLYGNGNYGRSVCMAVEQGFDTDCNGATVGSIVGMARGSGCIAPDWTNPICNTLDTSIFGVGKISVDELVERTLRHSEIAFND